VLLDPALGAIVDMVLACPEPGVYEAVSCDGAVRFRRGDRASGTFEMLDVSGEHPFANQSPATFAGLAAERARPYPGRRDNAYPHAYQQVAQLFDHPAAPDLCVVHSAAHNWEDQGGHRGEHGSLDVVQARAPFVLAGKGVRRDGYVPRAAQLVDVAPTLAALLGCDPPQGGDGAALTDVLDVDAERPTHVVGFLFDGTNANVLYAMAQAGEAPNVARLIELGTAYEWGALASFPTVTLANHTSIITGRFPGHHGILHNAWYDRANDQQIVTNSAATWPWAMQHTIEGTDSLFAAITRAWPDAFTASINEPCDIGSGYSTFDLFRAGDVSAIPKGPDGIPHATERFVRPSKDYSWSTTVDYMCVDQAASIWAGAYRDVDYPHPRFMWCNFTLTDAAFHAGGPYSEIAAASVHDSDARLGDVLDAVERAGVFDDTAFLLVADHGMEETDPAVQGDWDVALRDAGIEFRDEGYGFLYFI
jgi:predicted AlkP superfamily pyrophosphatase or phosphodiesterase